MSPITTLDDVGDSEAPRGTRPWVIATIRKARSVIDHLEIDAEHASFLLRTLSDSEAWKAMGYPSWGLLCVKELKLDEHIAEALLRAKKGETVGSVIERAKANPLNGHGEVGNGRSRDANSNSTKGGTTREYIAARLARDAPDILDRWDAGEFKSAKAAKEAAIESGQWVVKPRGVKAKPAAAAPVEPNEIGGMISCTVEEMECTIDGKPVHKVAAYLLGIEAWIAKTRGRLRITDD